MDEQGRSRDEPNVWQKSEALAAPSTASPAAASPAAVATTTAPNPNPSLNERASDSTLQSALLAIATAGLSLIVLLLSFESWNPRPESIDPIAPQAVATPTVIAFEVPESGP